MEGESVGVPLVVIDGYDVVLRLGDPDTIRNEDEETEDDTKGVGEVDAVSLVDGVMDELGDNVPELLIEREIDELGVAVGVLLRLSVAVGLAVAVTDSEDVTLGDSVTVTDGVTDTVALTVSDGVNDCEAEDVTVGVKLAVIEAVMVAENEAVTDGV